MAELASIPDLTAPFSDSAPETEPPGASTPRIGRRSTLSNLADPFAPEAVAEAALASLGHALHI